MKRLIGVMTIALGMGVAGLAHAATGAGITGSSHDFTDGMKGAKAFTGTSTATVTGDEAWNDRGEICRVCHVPHDHGRITYQNGLLWNHDVSTATFTMYNSPTTDYLPDASPTGNSKLCLGCHDGTVAIDAFDNHVALANNNATGVGFSNKSAGAGYDPGYKVPGITGDLQGTHPISIQYPVAGVTDEFKPASQAWVTGGTIATTLDDGKIQCSTCHDVHNQEVAPGTHLLRAGQTTAQLGSQASGLCLTCHIK